MGATIAILITVSALIAVAAGFWWWIRNEERKANKAYFSSLSKGICPICHGIGRESLGGRHTYECSGCGGSGWAKRAEMARYGLWNEYANSRMLEDLRKHG